MSRPNLPTDTAVILAAGMGSRLAGDELPKPLRPVAGTPLLARTLATLAAGGVARVVVVVGYRDRLVRGALADVTPRGMTVQAVLNPAWQLANGVSALHARDHVPARFLLCMADHVMTPGMVRALAASAPPERGALLMVDPDLPGVYDMDDATKVRTDGAGGVVAIGKALADYDVVDTGLFHCTSGLFDELEAVYAERGDASLSHGVDRLAADGRMRVQPLPAGEWWQDVDTPDALAEAERRLADQPQAQGTASQ